MALIDKFFPRGQNKTIDIKADEISAAFYIWSKFPDKFTKDDVINVFDLKGSDNAQLNQFESKFKGRPGEEKDVFNRTFFSLVVLANTDKITQPQFRSIIKLL